MSKIDYDLSKIRGIAFDVDGVLSPSTIPMSAEGVPLRMANLKDGYAMQLAVKSGLKLAIITGANVPSIPGRFNVIGVQHIYMGVADKLPVFNEWLAEVGLEADEVAYVGDDIPDIPVLRACGLPVAPRDGANEVKSVAKFISTADGGHGVARELLEEIMKVQGHWLDADKAYGW